MKTQILSILTSAALLGGATAATAAKTAQNDVKAVEATTGAGEKKICKRLETSGTRMIARTCLTKQEWKKLDALD